MVSSSTLDASGRIGTWLSGKRLTIQTIKIVTEHYRHVVFYGCGTLQQGIKQSWDRHIGRAIDFSCDEDPAKWGRTFCDATCLSPAELDPMKDECALFVTVADAENLAHSFRKAEFPFVQTLSPLEIDTSDTLSRLSNEQVIELFTSMFSALEQSPALEDVEGLLYQILSNPEDEQFLLNLCHDHDHARAQLIEFIENDRFDHQVLARRTCMAQDRTIAS